jgi:hypothetical protein
MEGRKMDPQKMIQKLTSFEAQLEVLKCECSKARIELERFYAPAPQKGKVSRYNATATKIVMNRNAVLLKRK